MRASRRNLAAAGALLAGSVAILAPGGALAGPALVGHGPAPVPAGGPHARFVQGIGGGPRWGWHGWRQGAGVFIAAPQADVVAPDAGPTASAWSESAAYCPPAGAPSVAATYSSGPKIIEIGARPARHVRWPVVVYGDF